MDIPRHSAARQRRIRRILYSVVALLVIAGISFGLSRLRPAAPSVESGTVWPDTVKRGPMLVQVHGLGTLVPEEIRWIPALTEGRVERLRLLPGAEVRPETILLDLSNSELELELVDAQSQLKAAEAEYADLQVSLESERLDQVAAAAKVQAEYHQAKLKADRDEILAREGLTPDLTLKLSQVTAQELGNRYNIENKRLEIYAESIKAQLEAQKAKVDRYRALYELRRNQVEALHVKAGTEGVLQQLPVERGQTVVPGTNLARVAEPKRLKAELKIPETQAKDIMIGQPATIDTRNGIIPGKVVRIDPAAQNGTVTVDVALEGDLPRGARPDLSVDGTVELERLADVLSVSRPVQVQPESQVTLFKIDPDGRGAMRVKVRLGLGSVDRIEILEGLNVGDKVLLSDMSAWDGYDRIRLN
jgi:HlyD family secretion protein